VLRSTSAVYDAAADLSIVLYRVTGFFAPRFEEAAKVGGKMIKTIQEESKRTTM
jgi:hypothetical protein